MSLRGIGTSSRSIGASLYLSGISKYSTAGRFFVIAHGRIFEENVLVDIILVLVHGGDGTKKRAHGIYGSPLFQGRSNLGWFIPIHTTRQEKRMKE